MVNINYLFNADGIHVPTRTCGQRIPYTFEVKAAECAEASLSSKSALIPVNLAGRSSLFSGYGYNRLANRLLNSVELLSGSDLGCFRESSAGFTLGILWARTRQNRNF